MERLSHDHGPAVLDDYKYHLVAGQRDVKAVDMWRQRVVLFSVVTVAIPAALRGHVL